jgi:hypothetical protein
MHAGECLVADDLIVPEPDDRLQRCDDLTSAQKIPHAVLHGHALSLGVSRRRIEVGSVNSR